MPTTPAPMATILRAVNLGSPDDAAQVMPLVYEELRAIARRQLRAERPDHTLRPTELVHEAYMRLAGAGNLSLEGRRHFLRLAARAMRQVLVDSARARGARKRGGEWRQVTLDTDVAEEGPDTLDVLHLHDVLDRLAELNPQLERLVELRFFTGLSVKEAAETLGISPRKAAMDWAALRLWLRKELSAG